MREKVMRERKSQEPHTQLVAIISSSIANVAAVQSKPSLLIKHKHSHTKDPHLLFGLVWFGLSDPSIH